MSDIRSTQSSTSQAPPQARAQAPGGSTAVPEREPVSGWAGWLIFAAILMIMAGAFQAIMGITALLKSGYYLVPQSRLLVHANYTAWGWVHLALGVIAVAAAFGLLAGQMWGRVVAVAMAMVSALVNLAFIPAYPLWSLIMITLDVFIVYAVIVHGSELKGRAI